MRNVIDENRVRKWEATAGAGCFLGGILAALMGSLLTAGEWIVGTPLHRWIHIAGTTLFIIAIPLILFAGFCLDWAEREPKKPLARDPLDTSDAETRRRGDTGTRRHGDTETVRRWDDEEARRGFFSRSPRPPSPRPPVSASHPSPRLRVPVSPCPPSP